MTVRAQTLAAAFAATVLTLATSSAAATTIHFNFENTGTLPVAPTDNTAHASLSFTREGVSLGVTAVARASDASAYEALSAPGVGVYFGDSGLGVSSAGPGDSTNMDGASDSATDGDVDEGLVFTFDREVVLTDINFGRWESGMDSVRFLVDGIHALTYAGTSDSPSGLNLRGTEFRFLAEQDSTGVRIQDIDITVPAPGPLALLGGALALAGLARRTRPEATG